MKRNALIAALAALALGITADATARIRISSHSHSPSHSASGSHQNHAGDTPHANDSAGSGVGSEIVRGAVNRSNRSSNNGNNNENAATASDIEQDPTLRRIREEKAAARAKANAEAMAERQVAEAEAADKRRQQAEQAAIAAAEQQKRRDAESIAKNKEMAAYERKRAQAAWEGRCQIKAVMTDNDIATCREVRSRSAL